MWSGTCQRRPPPSSTLLGRVWLAGSAVLSRHDSSGDRGGPAPAAGLHCGDARRNVARWFAASQPVDALVVDDTGFGKAGDAPPSVARRFSVTHGLTVLVQLR